MIIRKCLNTIDPGNNYAMNKRNIKVYIPQSWKVADLYDCLK